MPSSGSAAYSRNLDGDRLNRQKGEEKSNCSTWNNFRGFQQPIVTPTAAPARFARASGVRRVQLTNVPRGTFFVCTQEWLLADECVISGPAVNDGGLARIVFEAAACVSENKPKCSTWNILGGSGRSPSMASQTRTSRGCRAEPARFECSTWNNFRLYR